MARKHVSRIMPMIWETQKRKSGIFTSKINNMDSKTRAEFTALLLVQLNEGMAVSYPQLNTMALQLGAFYTVKGCSGVTRVDISFRQQGNHLVFVVTKGSSPIYVCIPCAAAKDRMYQLTTIINIAKMRLSGRDRITLAMAKGEALAIGEAYAQEPTWAECLSALDNHPAVVWGPEGIVPLEAAPVIPTAFKRTFSSAGVEVERDGKWIYDMRLLGTSPQVYCLGAKTPHEGQWKDLRVFVRGSIYSQQILQIHDIIHGPCIILGECKTVYIEIKITKVVYFLLKFNSRFYVIEDLLENSCRTPVV